ncbi:PAS-associated C-terminal [Penicillium taxi]|uniref:PAS-associated C-terminal n=1 Tax=Penicillium taxi TaxID=168475 RepID=UPI00254526A7|nr:PAS-associated C-terminal [Penicillium taxi]KAJ5899241.1 PAS-associated C-terminal [Penicillium taxi]
MPKRVDSDVSSAPTILRDESNIEYSQFKRHMQQNRQCPTPPNESESEHSSQASIRAMRRNFNVNDIPLLQVTNPHDGSDQFNPTNEESEESGCSYDLLAPYEGDKAPLHSLERQADTMFSTEHMLVILTNPQYLARFREFLLAERPRSILALTYYLNTAKAMKALQYANALVRLSVDVPTAGIETAKTPVGSITNPALEARVQDALQALTAEELPAFITSTCINITSKVVEERVRGTLPEKFQRTADALAEVFCLTDPSRPDNPIIFASGEFHRTTQYGMDYVLGRNCRFLQGPKTNPNSVRRIREAIQAGRHHSELFLNYRRDGSPFMNLLQCSPLCDSQGKVKYFIGAQVDVSGLAMEGAQMESLQNLQNLQQKMEKTQLADNTSEYTTNTEKSEKPQKPKSLFEDLGQLLSPREVRLVYEQGGMLFHPVPDQLNPKNSRLFIPGPENDGEVRLSDLQSPTLSGSLAGVYKNYLLIRPYPSLRILFTSPSLQIPGMMQTSFMSRIGDTGEKRDSILQAMMTGRGVTARIKWVTRYTDQGRYRWIHCTPLLANNGQVGVWMVVVIDDEEDENFVRWKGNWPTDV